MRVIIDTDELPEVHFISDEEAGGRSVDVPPEMLARWEATWREFRAVQDEMGRAIIQHRREQPCN